MTCTSIYRTRRSTVSSRANPLIGSRPAGGQPIWRRRPISGRSNSAALGKVIGQLYLKLIEPTEHLTCELGYILSPAYQRQGYGSEAAAALVRQALTTGGMHRVVAHCNPENTASWKLLEKIGFRREGLLRQNIFFRRSATGEPLWIDTYVYAWLASEVDLCS